MVRNQLRRPVPKTNIGYARVSTTDHDLDAQIAALKAVGCDLIRVEKRSRASAGVREELLSVLSLLQRGDILTVTRVDRLARSIHGLQDIVCRLQAKGVALRTTEQPIDTSTAVGKAFLGMLGIVAAFESNGRRERQVEGIAAAKATGAYKAGRKRSIDYDAVAMLKAKGLGATAIAKQLGIARASVYRKV
jgi:DNA invertase Pin-like site-specific DNA recombinase